MAPNHEIQYLNFSFLICINGIPDIKGQFDGNNTIFIGIDNYTSGLDQTTIASWFKNQINDIITNLFCENEIYTQLYEWNFG